MSADLVAFADRFDITSEGDVRQRFASSLALIMKMCECYLGQATVVFKPLEGGKELQGD